MNSGLFSRLNTRKAFTGRFLPLTAAGAAAFPVAGCCCCGELEIKRFVKAGREMQKWETRKKADKTGGEDVQKDGGAGVSRSWNIAGA